MSHSVSIAKVNKIDERRRAIVVKHSVVVGNYKENGLQENYIRIEIIIQKYKALGATEIDEVKNERYDFRFCACNNETSEPERSGDCSCSTVVSGQTTQNSIPQALYSSSCVHNPHYNKCLIAQITANTTQ
ncbi:unnamed protein product, partial [Brugia timori]|uniref:Uncharacterized protein n=1 Tax=Brugia timori TaxID=42155 RepID=A0A0R3R8U0_9BILA